MWGDTLSLTFTDLSNLLTAVMGVTLERQMTRKTIPASQIKQRAEPEPELVEPEVRV